MTEQYVTLAEVKDLLTAENLERELLPTQKAAMEHAEKTAALSTEDAKALMAEVMEIEGVTDYVAVKIADLIPQFPEDVRAIFSKERITLDAPFITKIIEVVSKYL
ncbi:MAG: RNA polymerase Rpb4 family protein [Candidatus Methanoplasma sp.]|jgi:DNA-directed RNA polymerase subunit F|nr:RNA polymerase Rpb4 family protein [Candidatus Methanoplasma sp.]